MHEKTVDDAIIIDDGDAALAPRPGVLVVFSGASSRMIPLAFEGGERALGREILRAIGVEDERLSRQHVRFVLEGSAVRVRDLGSTNGVFVAGERVQNESVVLLRRPSVVRIGHTVLLVLADVRPFELLLASQSRKAARGAIVNSSVIAGPALALIHRQVEALARAGEGLFIRGESGSGKEIAAKIFHDASPRRNGPLVAVNCAAIPKELAERLFFGATRGAYSGAVADAQGYLQAARGGTLFLDEVAELDLSVQSKLLRAIETREVIALGATRATPVDLGLIAATWTDLRAAVTDGRFREDLYYRIGRPEVRVPPLRERLDEIAQFVERGLAANAMQPSASLIEAALLRPWPGNVRELFAELRAAAALARAAGSAIVYAQHMDARAGHRLSEPAALEPPVEELAPPARPSATGALETAVSQGDRVAVQRAADMLGVAHKTVSKLLTPASLAECFARAERSGLDHDARLAALKALFAESLLALLEAHDFKQSLVANELSLSRTTLQKLVTELSLPSASALSDAAIDAALRDADGDSARAARALRVSGDALKKRLARRDGS
ncbi:MAG: sigma 54-interacting transcriptional regulator [Myxococcales bacterium]|nr:sigma 54-interacting transcriptional regulator [Myxococcales bacterium]